MSERIEELRNELRGAIDRAEHIMDGSGMQPYLQYSTGALTELLAHIDHLTATLREVEAERKDLAMLVRRLAFGLKGTKREKLQEQALDYLERKGLQGNILREE